MTAPSRSTPQIFISHSHKDDEFALKLASDLRKELGDDKAVWIDKEGGLQGGDNWKSVIIKQIASRNIFIVVLSSAAMDSPWVKFEIAQACKPELKSRKRILPIRYNDDIFEVPEDLAEYQEIDFRNPRPQAFGELCAQCLKPIERRISRRTLITVGVVLAGASISGLVYKMLFNPAIQQTVPPALPLLYQANWSQGLNGWGSPGYTTGDLIGKPNTVHKGWLLCNGVHLEGPGYGSGSSMFAPFLPATANYAVEVEIQVIDTFPQTACAFGILVRWLLDPSSKGGGYVAGIGGLEVLRTPFFEIIVGQDSTTKVEGNASGGGYVPGTSWHRYRVEAKDTSITMYIDGQKIFAETNHAFFDAGQVGLLCSACKINVRNFKVIGL